MMMMFLAVVSTCMPISYLLTYPSRRQRIVSMHAEVLPTMAGPHHHHHHQQQQQHYVYQVFCSCCFPLSADRQTDRRSHGRHWSSYPRIGYTAGVLNDSDLLPVSRSASATLPVVFALAATCISGCWTFSRVAASGRWKIALGHLCVCASDAEEREPTRLALWHPLKHQTTPK